MKVVHIASADLWGGAEAQVSALAAALVKIHGARVSAVLMNRGSRLGSELRSNGIPLLELDETRTSMAALLRQIASYLRSQRPDIVHTHRLKEDVLGSIAAAVAGIPSVRTVHGAPEPETSQGLRRTVLNTADRWVARSLQSRVVAVSQDLMHKLEPLLPGARFAVIPNGISFDAVRTAAAGEASALPRVAPTSFRVGFFGRLVGVKRVDLLLQVADQLAATTERPFEFHIVGEGPLRSDLEALARSVRAPERVHFLGYQPNAAALMRQMDAVILVSDHEGLPMVLLEAAVLRVPVVARAVGGIPEFMATAGWGTAIDSGDPTVIAAQLLSVSLGAERRSGPASSSLANYSIERTSASYLELYRQVLGKSSA